MFCRPFVVAIATLIKLYIVECKNPQLHFLSCVVIVVVVKLLWNIMSFILWKIIALLFQSTNPLGEITEAKHVWERLGRRVADLLFWILLVFLFFFTQCKSRKFLESRSTFIFFWFLSKHTQVITSWHRASLWWVVTTLNVLEYL